MVFLFNNLFPIWSLWGPFPCRDWNRQHSLGEEVHLNSSSIFIDEGLMQNFIILRQHLGKKYFAQKQIKVFKQQMSEFHDM